MKNNKTTGGKTPTCDTTSRTLPPTGTRLFKSASLSSTTTSNKKNTGLGRTCMSACSSSQESLAGSITSVRRKVSVPVTKHPTVLTTKVRLDSTPTPIRTISNIPGSKSGLGSRKNAYKLSNQSNMRRAMSKDRVDLVRSKEKENVKLGFSRGQGKGSINNCVTIIQLEKDKAMMEQQISELVRNAETKKAEIATLKMENNKLKDLQSDDAVEQLRQELEVLQQENQALKDRLVQLGAPLETTALSDSQKEQLLLQSSLRSSSLQNLQSSQDNLSGTPKSLDTEPGEASGVTVPRPLSDWDKASSSSMSEMSVACLQDRIIQMEETHHSTNEELQATLQELTDLQDQLADLQLESDRMTDEKAVLLESLCSQTEKLEECRMQVAQLKQLLFQQYEHGDQAAVLSASEREKSLVELLKKAQEANDLLLMKQEELSSALESAQKDSGGAHTNLILLRDRVRIVESTIESMNAGKHVLELQLKGSREQLSANQIEISQLKLQLENEQQKVSELQKEREASATSELNALLQEMRKDKEKVEEKVVQLQEQLARSQQEVNRLKDQLVQMQEENTAVKSSSEQQVSDLEYKIECLQLEKAQIHQETTLLNQALQQSELKCQHHLEDKRELKANVGELQKALNDANSHLKEVQTEMEEMKKQHNMEIDEWNKFQADLLTTVRVANDFKTEAQHNVERVALENKQLKAEAVNLRNEIVELKAKQEVVPAPLRHGITFNTTDVTTLSNIEKDINAVARRQFGNSKVRDRGANQLSVKSLIESIENATKQAKGQGPASSCSSSTSSLNSVASDSRNSTNALLFTNSSEMFMKRPDKSNNHITRLPNSSNIESVCYSLANVTTITNDSVQGVSGKTENEGIKTIPSHPVSILANKLDPIRRSSYGDVAEKKDPLSSLIKGGGSKRNALLKWCQNKTMGYKGIDITNFSSSWNDGLAFCALIHSYLPNLIPYDELDCKDKKRNFTLAFQSAESVGIRATLNISDLISQERPDWQSIMAYVTSIYKHFET